MPMVAGNVPADTGRTSTLVVSVGTVIALAYMLRTSSPGFRAGVRMRLDPNFKSRVEMMRKARMGEIIAHGAATTEALLDQRASDLADDLISQHTLVSPEQAAELEAHFNL